MTARRVAPLAALILTLIAAGVLLGTTGGTALLGWDTYPILLTSQITSAGDLLDIFTQRLMSGFHPSEFYRPMLNLTIALDTSLWGRRPFGFHLTDILLFAAAALVLYALMRRLLGPRAYLGPLVALLFFLLHPTHIEVLPVPPRRPEILCALLMLLSLTTQLSPRALAERKLPLLPALFSLLAFLAKETSFVLPALSFSAVLLCAPQPTLARRAQRAAWALGPHLGALLLVLLARFAVLGGFGGHSTTDFGGAALRFPSYFGHMLGLLIAPQGPLRTSALLPWLLVLLGVALLASAVLSRRWRPERRLIRGDAAALGRTPAKHVAQDVEPSLHPLRTGLLGLVWLALIGLSYAIVAEMSAWYMLLPVVGLAIVGGATAEGLFQEIRATDAVARYAAASAGILLVALLAWLAVYSPVVHRYPEWRVASEVGESFLARVRTLLVQTPDGRVVEGPPLPTWVRPARGAEMEPRVFGAAIFSTYTIEAWARLEFPDRRILVHPAPTIQGAQAAADEVLLIFTARLEGY